MKKNIGIVGNGNMGAGMANRLLSMGWPVHVHDIDNAKQKALEQSGAHGHGSAAAVARAADVIIVCVIDAVQVQQVFDGAEGLLAGLSAGQTVIMCPRLHRRKPRVLKNNVWLSVFIWWMPP